MAIIAKYPSVVITPAVGPPFPSIAEFLFTKFPNVSLDRWTARIRSGKVLDDARRPITMETTYSPRKRLFYFREVENEPRIPFAERIVFQNDELLVACKPHFLPVIPGGPYVEECLVSRLRTHTGIDDLVPIHRLDRETAGIVLFSVNPNTRARYHALFMQHKIEKTYFAVAEAHPAPPKTQWDVENRIVTDEPRFRMKVVPGSANARSHIRLAELKDGRALFELRPATGKTHQLRLHLSGLGFKIVNDRVYPELQAQCPDDFNRPLQLLAKSVRFRDPISGKDLTFTSERALLW